LHAGYVVCTAEESLASYRASCCCCCCRGGYGASFLLDFALLLHRNQTTMLRF
jgi:hypothetical protein